MNTSSKLSSNAYQINNEVNNGSTQIPNTEHQRLGWWKDSARNRPQSNSLCAASFIFSSAGMSLALSIGFGKYPQSTHIQICWFIGVIIGACISAGLAHHISKRVFNIIASVLVIINGVLYIAAGDSTTAIVLARYCDGIAFGLTLIPTILAGSEQSVKRLRGNILSIEQLSLTGGSTLILALMSNITFTSRWQGICAAFFGLVALVLTFILTLESPVFLLRKGNENEAVNVLRRLQRPTAGITDETYALLNESKALLEEDTARGIAVNISNSWIPMAKMCLYRCFVMMSFFYPLTAILLKAVNFQADPSNVFISFNFFFFCIYVLMRFLGVIISSYLVDTIGRRTPSSIALIAGGGVLFAIASQDMDIANTELISSQTVIYLLCLYQLFAGIVAPTCTCYLSEAFSISLKPLYILAIIIVENILQIITCCVISNFSSTLFCWTLGSMQIVYGIVFYFTMPETKQTTLRKALEMFQLLVFVPDCLDGILGK